MIKLLKILYKYNTSLRYNINIYFDNIILNYLKNNFWLQIWKWTYWYNAKTFFHLNNRDNATIKIWKYCSLWWWLKIFASAEHNYRRPTTFPFYLYFNKNSQLWFDPDNFSKWSVIIWNDVWIWDWVTILSWVTIWDWAVIWACSLVSKNIPPYSIAVWNPCKVIKNRFNEKIINDLQEIKWWDWDDKKIKQNYNFLIWDIDLFCSKFKK